MKDRFTFVRFLGADLQGYLTWTFSDSKTRLPATLRFQPNRKAFWAWTHEDYGSTASSEITDALKNALPPEELARATALSLTQI